MRLGSIAALVLATSGTTRAQTTAPALDVGSFAFTHVTLIDMTGAPPQPDMTVIVTGSRIAAIGRSSTMRLPIGTSAIDGTGKYLIPGLWDMHVHAAWEDRTGTYFPLFLANGVTGIRDTFGRLSIIGAARVRLSQGRLTEPRIVGSGPILDGPNPVWEGSVAVGTAEQGRRAVDSLKAAGADFIKVYNRLPKKAYFAVAAEAKRQSIPFVGHVPTAVTSFEAAEAGQRSIEHLSNQLLTCSSREAEFREARLKAAARARTRDSTRSIVNDQLPLILASYDARKCERLAALYRSRQTWQVPTLIVLRNSAWLDDTTLARDPRLRYVSAEQRADWDPRQDFRFKALTPQDFANRKAEYKKVRGLVGLLHRTGVPLLAGSDTPNPYCLPGFGLHDELSLLVEAGLSPMQALQTATVNPARFLGITDSLGTVEAGKLADLVLLGADPLADIRNTSKVEAVVLNGGLIDQAHRQRLLDEVQAQVALPRPAQ